MIIYEPRGRAREYSPLAANLYRGCAHGCKYCYAPSCLYMDAASFHRNPTPRQRVFEQLKKEAPKYHNDEREVLLCFTSDPYQPIEQELGLTRSVLALFAAANVKYSVLTKGGSRAVRDFDIMSCSKARYGTTLLFIDEKSRLEWEPNASTINDRIQAIQKAHELGIPTYISVEPVIDPAQALKLVAELNPIVDFWKIGKLNHHPLAKQIDWVRFHNDVVELLKSLDADFYIKKDLSAFVK